MPWRCAQWPSPLHVRDIGAGFITLLASDLRGCCNIASGVATPLVEMIAKIGALSGRGEHIEIGAPADRPDDPRIPVGDNRLLFPTGWRATMSLHEGLDETYQRWAGTTK